ncbi:D-lactate dehydrogenase [Rosenbergiella australiborealis]|uniref:D-lactate dehydrogenase n=1 Tax=Rosenbergiella australiborealis TaxID=1544696 RepID=UPI001F4DCDDA|nr:D-lactate dehydrogenase [Rosenbergiella australiborealis]
MTLHTSAFLEGLSGIVGTKQVITDQDEKSFYTTGFRVGKGDALAVIIPQSLTALWQVLTLCVAQDVIILMQASNTGITGGSTPDGNDYDRPVVIISTRQLTGIQVIDNGQQVIAYPGSTLTELEEILRPLQREPHSVIGSSCIGASVIGGLCNNSGGSLIRRGPAFTEKSLYAQISEQGELTLINHLGIKLGDTPEEILRNLENKHFTIGDADDWQGKIWADDYAQKLRDTESDLPARFNGDKHYLHDSAGCAGKIIVFAARLATFPASSGTETWYIGTDDEKVLITLRRHLLQHLDHLPIQAEYIHANAFDMTLRYAKHMILAIRQLGPQSIPGLMKKKAMCDVRVKKIRWLPHNLTDRLIQGFNQVTPPLVAKRILEYRQRFHHHLIIKADSEQAPQLTSLLKQFFSANQGDYFVCDKKEAKDAFLLRFAVAGAAIAYCDYLGVDPNERLIAFDAALRRNDEQWLFDLPTHLQQQIQADACCGHFFCLVNHQDYVLKPGVDGKAFKQAVIDYIEQRGARYPAEHNVGHLYAAREDYQQHWHQLDPTNTCNPGIGKTSRRKFWK